MRRLIVVSSVIVTSTFVACASRPQENTSARADAHAQPPGALAAGDDVGLAAFRPRGNDGTRVVTVPITAD